MKFPHSPSLSRRAIALIVTAWLAIGSSSFSLAAQVDTPLIERGQAALENGDAELALELFIQAVEVDAENVEAHLGLANAQFGLDQVQESFESYERAMKLDRSNADACIHYANASLYVDREVKGIQALSRFLRKNPDHVGVLTQRGVMYSIRGQERRAIKDLSRVADEPGMEWSLSYYAGSLMNEGELESCIVQATRAIEYEPEDSYAWWVRGYGKYFTGDLGGGLADFEQAVDLDPDLAESPYSAYALGIGGGGPEPEISDLEAIGAFVTAALIWALFMGVIGLAMGLGGSKYLVPREHRSHSGTQPGYDGPHRELFTIYVQNVALTVVTFGVYRFWAKVRTRRFHLTHTTLADGRFDYHATGQEKFMGFVKGMLILLPFGAGYYFLTRWGAEHPTRVLAQLGLTYGLFFGLYLIRPLALVGGQRFNLARTSWNNLRFRFTGRLKDAYKLYLGDAVLIIFTLGIYWSWHLCKVKRFKLHHTALGEKRTEFTGSGGTLLGIQFRGVLLSSMTLGFYVPWYLAERHRFWTNHTQFMGKRFSSTLSGKAVLAVGGPGLLASIFSLGLALPWAVTRWRRMIAATTYYRGTIDAETMTSIRDTAATSTLEGVGEAGEFLGEIGDLFGV